MAIGGDLLVTRIGLGTMSLTGAGTWGPPRDRRSARALLNTARDLGVELFDTADSYGPEVAESLLAEAFAPQYDGIVVASKAGLTRQGPGRWERDGRPERLRAACEGSLRRLNIERIDLLQLHAVDPAVPLEESLGALVELRAEGKVRHLGVCNVDVEQLERARACAPIVAVQNRYSLAERGAHDVLERCTHAGLAFLAWAPLGKGVLTRTGGRLARIAESRGLAPSQVALAWLLHRSDAAIPIPGTTSADHLRENVGAASVELTPDELDGLERQMLLGYRAQRLRRRARISLGALRRTLRGSASRR